MLVHTTSGDLIADAERFGLRAVAGPAAGAFITRVELVDVDRIQDLAPGTLAIVTATSAPPPYRLDIAIRQAGARRLSGLIFVVDPAPAATAAALAQRAGVPVLVAPGARPSELAFALDRRLGGGATETMARAAFAIERVTTAAAGPSPTLDGLLKAAADALGTRVRLVEDAAAPWSEPTAVFIGAVPLGRLEADEPDDATALALPVIATVVSRTMHRDVSERFAPTLSRADLIVELILAESSRVEGFVGQAVRLGLPLQLSHVVGWLKPTHRVDPDRRPPHTVQPALELFALQLVDHRDELWHVAFVQDEVLIVSSEEHGAGDHQRRLREVGATIRARAGVIAGDDWTYTLGLGTPQLGPAGLRQSAAEARVAAESAIAAGRAGGIEVTDVTGLRRVLLDFYASPASRSLLHDILRPLDEWGQERAAIAIRTLASYLGHRNSLQQAARELTLHPNAVGYRLKRIREALQVDLDDPDTRFAVELACRVRMLGAGAR